MTEYDDEQRQEVVAEKAQKLVEFRTVRVLIGDVVAKRDLCNSVLDLLADTQLLPDLVEAALKSGARPTDDTFAGAVMRLMHDEADEQAEAEVKRIEQDRKEQAQQRRIENRVWDRMYSGSTA